MPLLKSAYLVRICINKENSSCIITSYGQCESKFVFSESWHKLSSLRVKKCIQIKYHLIVNNLWHHGEIKIQLDPNKVCFLLHLLAIYFSLSIFYHIPIQLPNWFKGPTSTYFSNTQCNYRNESRHARNKQYDFLTGRSVSLCKDRVSFILTKYCKTVCQMCHKNLCSLLLNIGQSNFPSLNHNTNTMYIAFFIYPAFLYRREQQFMCIDFWGLWWKPCNWIICQIKSTVCYIHCTRHNHKVYKQNSYCITCS